MSTQHVCAYSLLRVTTVVYILYMYSGESCTCIYMCMFYFPYCQVAVPPGMEFEPLKPMTAVPAKVTSVMLLLTPLSSPQSILLRLCYIYMFA